MSRRAFALCAGLLLTAPVPALLHAQAQAPAAALPQAWTPPPPARFQTGQVTAVRAGRLFDPKSGTLRTNQIILMRDDRIVEVGPNVAIPAGARTIDLSRATVLPGLIDTHLHTMTGSPLTAPGGPGVGPKGTGPAGFAQPIPYHTLVALTNAQRDLDAGFTTVVDLMSHGGWFGTVDLRNAINYGVVPGPRMQVAGPGMINATTTAARVPLLDREPLSNLGHIVARTVEGVKKAVDDQAAAGVDWIKIYSTNEYTLNRNGTMDIKPTFTLEETQAIVTEAHAKGLKVACHAYGGEGLRNCIGAGVDVPTHALDLDDASMKMLLEKKLPLTVTMFDLSMEHAREMERYGNSRWSMMEKSFKKALAAGVVLPFGSGAGPFAHGTQGEQFAYLVKWGVSPVQALRAATTTAADLIGWSADVGSIEAGKFADLVAVAGDPLADITEMSRVIFVMKGGQVIRSAAK